MLVPVLVRVVKAIRRERIYENVDMLMCASAGCMSKRSLGISPSKRWYRDAGPEIDESHRDQPTESREQVRGSANASLLVKYRYFPILALVSEGHPVCHNIVLGEPCYPAVPGRSSLEDRVDRSSGSLLLQPPLPKVQNMYI